MIKSDTAIVIGSGPSLHFADLELIKQCTSIAVNSSILKVPFADYYFTCDFGMTVWHSWEILKDLSCKIVLYNVDVGFRYLERLTKEDTFRGISDKRVKYFSMHGNGYVLRRWTHSLIRGSTSTQVAVNYAYALGFTKIVLVGCDNQYVDGKYHYYDFPGEIKDDYRKEEYKSFKKTYNDYQKFLQGHYVCWKKIAEANLKVKIIDSSNGGLDMFPQMSLKDAINA